MIERTSLMELVVTNHVTLDGVMQGPMAREEDRRDGFEDGGWAAANADEVMAQAMADGIARGGSLLLGRRTYEQMASFWPHQSDDVPYAKVINERAKYVASRTLKAPLAWRNAALLEGDAGEAVAALKKQGGPDLGVLGSGELIQTLMRRDLVDQWVILIHPLVLGAGRRLFPEGGAPASFRLAASRTTTTGVVIASYERA